MEKTEKEGTKEVLFEMEINLSGNISFEALTFRYLHLSYRKDAAGLIELADPPLYVGVLISRCQNQTGGRYPYFKEKSPGFLFSIWTTGALNRELCSSFQTCFPLLHFPLLMTLFRKRACITLVSYLQPLVTLQMLTVLGKFLSFTHLRKSHHLFIQNCGTGIVVLEETLKSPLDCKEVKPANPQGNQPWIPIGRADAEAETPILWPPDAKSRLIVKAKGEEGSRGWDAWMASPTQWT